MRAPHHDHCSQTAITEKRAKVKEIRDSDTVHRITGAPDAI